MEKVIFIILLVLSGLALFILLYSNWLKTKTIYHGGCLLCDSQEINGKWRCRGCQFHSANWNLPNLSTFRKEDYEVPDRNGFIRYHGGCAGCQSQKFYGLKRCEGCEYRKPDWSLPDLSVTLPRPLFKGGKLIYHGGCVSCDSQKEHGIKRCFGCMYQKPDWGLPDLSTNPYKS